jgi:quercetin dioxygenase-like cupin family protein
MSRVDYAPWGVNPPHTHPRAAEMLFVLEGCLDVGFVTAAGKLFARTVSKGDLFVFPRGLVHFQRNNGGAPAVAISAFNSQLPGVQFLAQALSAASPPVPTDALSMST